MNLIRQVIFIKDIDPDTMDGGAAVNIGDLFRSTVQQTQPSQLLLPTSVPNMITSVDDWPRSTNQLCHYCGISIDGVPAPAVISHDSRSGVFMLCKYVYCSFDHRLNELEERNLITSERKELEKLTFKIAKLFGANPPERGISKDERKVFGGKYDDREYKMMIRQIAPS